MAGSNVPVPYQRDDGTFYALNRDESNSRGTITAPGTPNPLPLFNPPANPFVGSLPPKGFVERYANTYLKTDPRVRRRFPIGNPAAYALASKVGAEIQAALSGSSANATDWVVTSSRGEQSPRNLSFTGRDTGFDDGTIAPSIT